MKKLLIALILILLGGGGYYAYVKYGKVEDKASVTQAAVTQGNIVQAVQATGTLEAVRTVQVGSQVSGTVKAIYADFNSIVKKDQVIAELDPSLLQVQVEVQNANIQRQEGDIAQQKVQLENDQVNLKRAEAQAKAGLVSPQQLEASQLQVKSRQAQIASAEKQVIQSRAQLDQAKLNVSYCTIKSPIDGVIINRAADVGQTIQSSMQVATLFLIAQDLTTLKLSASVDESEIGYIRRGMSVTFQVDTYGTQQFAGTVDAVRLNAQTNSNVVTYPVWIQVPNDDLKLRPSLTANLKIIVDQANNVLKVPNQALRFRPTTDIYTWLGMQPPAAGKGRGANANADATKGGAGKGAPGAPADASATPGVAPGAGPATKADAGQDLTALAGGGNNRRQKGQAGDQAAGGGQGFGQNRQPGQGRGGNADALAQGGQGRRGQGGASGQGSQGFGQNRQPGQGGGRGQTAADATGGRGGRGTGGAGGFGRGMGNNLTPEQMAQFQQQFGGRGGRGQGGQGGRGGNRQPTVANAPTGGGTPLTERNADKIDDLFAEVQRRVIPGQVWIYDEKATDPNKKLRQVSVRIGLTDTQSSELVWAGENLTAGSMVVTGVIPPPSALPKPGQTNIFQQQRGGGPGGFQGGGPGGPGGGNPGGGRGGGGRGGGN